MTEDTHLENIRAIAELKTQVANVAADVSTVIKQMDMVWSLQNQMATMQNEQINNKDSLRRAFDRIELSEKVGAENKESTEKWINRGIGAWFAGVILIAIINWLVIDRVGRFETTQERNGDNITTLDRRMAWVEYELKQRAKKDPLP